VTDVTVAPCRNEAQNGDMSGCGVRRYGDSKEAFIRHAQKMAGVFMVVLFIWAVTGFGAFWPGWVLLIGGLKLGNHARRVYGGTHIDDPDDVEALV
jgi:hypothetical protein